MSCSQMLESFRAGSDDGGLQLDDGTVLESSDISQVADHAAGRGRQPSVGIDEQAERFGLNGHRWWPEKHRKLPSNPGNTKDHPSKVPRCPVPCRSISTVRRYSPLPA